MPVLHFQDPEGVNGGDVLTLHTARSLAGGHTVPARSISVLRGHSVHFYENDDAFTDNLSEHIGSSLGSGAACVAFLSARHRELVAWRLNANGFDLERAVQTDRYIALDAQEMLDRFVVNGWPDEELFHVTIEPVLIRARASLIDRSAAVMVFGEMVALLWVAGRPEPAIRLEQLWNRLARWHNFTLRCAYPLTCFRDPSQEQLDELTRLCLAEANQLGQRHRACECKVLFGSRAHAA